MPPGCTGSGCERRRAAVEPALVGIAPQQRSHRRERVAEAGPALVERDADGLVVAGRRSRPESGDDPATGEDVEAGQRLGQRGRPADDRVGHRGDQSGVPGRGSDGRECGGSVQPGRPEHQVVVGADGLEAQGGRRLGVLHEGLDAPARRAQVHQRQMRTEPHPTSAPRARENASMTTGELSWSEVAGVELDVATLYDVLALRSAVFVVEQECAYQDIDGLDLAEGTRARHREGRRDRGVRPGARARRPAPGAADRPGDRGAGGAWTAARPRADAAGAGRSASERWPDKAVELGAQAHLTGFYGEPGLRGGQRAVRRGRDPARLDATTPTVGFRACVPSCCSPLLGRAPADAGGGGRGDRCWGSGSCTPGRPAGTPTRAISPTPQPLPLTKVMSGDDPFPGEYLGQPVTLRGDLAAEGHALRRRPRPATGSAATGW